MNNFSEEQARPPRLSGLQWRAGIYAEAYIKYVVGVKPAENPPSYFGGLLEKRSISNWKLVRFFGFCRGEGDFTGQWKVVLRLICG